MNNIKGLILKDILIFKNFRKNIIMSSIIYISIIMMAASQINVLFYGTAFFIFIYGINSISTFSYDEMDNSEKYLLSLTLNRKELVFSKYLFAILNMFIVTIFGFIISLISGLLCGTITDVIESLRNIVLMFTGVSFLICADIPCIYKWGVEKGRMQATIVPVFLIFIIGFIVVLLAYFFPSLKEDYVIDTLKTFAFSLCYVLNIIMYYVSYKISYKIFSKKDS
jgi:ABC-type transport system involved in multi-copper enzyme maturation permease subunit